MADRKLSTLRLLRRPTWLTVASVALVVALFPATASGQHAGLTVERIYGTRDLSPELVSIECTSVNSERFASRENFKACYRSSPE